MKLCEQVTNKQEILISEVQLPKPSKYSLKERKFHNPQIQPSLSKRSWNCDSGSNRFVSFMEQHNNLLAKKCKNQNQIQTEGEDQFLGCFDINCQGAYGQTFISKMAVKHYPTFSTLSSSNASELATTQQFSQRERQGKFKINTKSILSQLIKEGYCAPERNRVSSGYELNKSQAAFQGERKKSGSLYDTRSVFQNNSDKKQKISLRKKNLALISESQLNRKESVNYQQLSNPLCLGSQIQNLSSSNLKISIIIEEYPSFSQTGSNDNSNSDCCCQPCCKWIDRWLTYTEGSTVGNMKRVAVDEKTLTQIDKDTPRTQKNKLFLSSFYRRHLRDVLMDYSSLNPKIGYVQGMNFIASTIIYHTRSYNISSRIFNSLMIQKQFQNIYEGDFSVLTQLTQHLYQEIKKYSKKLFIQINQCGIELEVFARGWYLSMLGSFVPLESMHLVVDKFFRKGLKGINQILLTLLIYLKQELMEVEYDEMAMKLSNSWLCERAKTINWEQLVGCSENIMINPVPL